jgi:hypothetical protein
MGIFRQYMVWLIYKEYRVEQVVKSVLKLNTNDYKGLRLLSDECSVTSD